MICIRFDCKAFLFFCVWLYLRGGNCSLRATQFQCIWTAFLNFIIFFGTYILYSCFPFLFFLWKAIDWIFLRIVFENDFLVQSELFKSPDYVTCFCFVCFPFSYSNNINYIPFSPYPESPLGHVFFLLYFTRGWIIRKCLGVTCQ